MSHVDGGVDGNSGACDVDDEFDENSGAVVVPWLYCCRGISHNQRSIFLWRGLRCVAAQTYLDI